MRHVLEVMLAQRASNEVKTKAICDGHCLAQHSGDYKCKLLPLKLKRLKLPSFRRNVLTPPSHPHKASGEKPINEPV